jgi:hypothetical protein
MTKTQIKLTRRARDRGAREGLKARVKREYPAHASPQDLANELGVSLNYLRKLAGEVGVTRNAVGPLASLEKNDIRLIGELRDKYKIKFTEIAEKFEISLCTVRSAFSRYLDIRDIEGWTA